MSRKPLVLHPLSEKVRCSVCVRTNKWPYVKRCDHLATGLLPESKSFLEFVQSTFDTERAVCREHAEYINNWLNSLDHSQ